MSHRLEEWLPRVYRFARRLCQDASVAEDLTQDAMLRAWRCRHELRNPAAVRVWLFRITANLWHDRLRRQQSPIAQAQGLSGNELGAPIAPDFLPTVRDELSFVLAALDQLPARQREVLYLSACEEMSSAEVAEVLGITSDSAKANLSLARKRMREICEPHPANRAP